jgi:hypothetical protein
VAVFTWRTSIRAIQQTKLGEVWLAGTAYLPVWPSRWILPIAAFMMALYLALRVVSDVAALARHNGAAK